MDLAALATQNASRRNLPAEILRRITLETGEVKETGKSVVAYTGPYTGRCPEDRFIVASPAIAGEIGWDRINKPVAPATFDRFLEATAKYLSERPAYVFDGSAGVAGERILSLRVITEHAYEALFAEYLFERSGTQPAAFTPELTLLVAPGCRVDSGSDGPQGEAFILLDLERKLVLIGGTAYCGEIKKAVFSVLNFLLPAEGILPMHCAATVDGGGRSALYFGLSGTGKTTLSSDPARKLIGDDEHGWSPDGIFNFENGCYAKCIRLSQEGEPFIWQAIEAGALLENVVLRPDGTPDFDDAAHTENTRAAYPLRHSPLASPERRAAHPEAVIFLTADAFGVLPPIARLTTAGALYHFMSGYTSKLAGTEKGVKEPAATFSACFGAPFMPRPVARYARLLRERLEKTQAQVFLLNTGWCRGPYGTGTRFPLDDTRAMLRAALSGALDRVPYRHDERFNLDVPTSIPGIDQSLLDPAALWTERKEYEVQANKLADLFAANARALADMPQEVRAAGPNGNPA